MYWKSLRIVLILYILCCLLDEEDEEGEEEECKEQQTLQGAAGGTMESIATCSCNLEPSEPSHRTLDMQTAESFRVELSGTVLGLLLIWLVYMYSIH